MKYKLVENYNSNSSIKEKVLENRGINNPKKYLSLTDKDILDYHLLDNIDNAVLLLNKHIENNSKICIVPDFDPDGITSSAILYLYLKKAFPKINLIYSLHSKPKSHGLASDVIIPENTNLIILPDSASNDIDECKIYSDKGIDILILDHHIVEKENRYAVIVNNQSSLRYDNKQLSAAGIVWQFCRALDDDGWFTYADDYLDLVALGNISDSMDIKSFETRRLIDKGLANIRSKIFNALISKQSYSLNGIIDITNVQFYITPILNGLLRFGSQDDIDLLFRAFIETDEIFKYKKPGKDSVEVDENIYDRVSRMCVNAKAKQNRNLDQSLEKLNEEIKKHEFDKNKILFVNAGDLDYSLTGLTAMKLANQYNRPCLVLRASKEGWGGSARNLESCGLDNLKDFLLSTGLFEYCNGHPGAFGISLKKENLRPVIEKTNELLKDFSFEKIWNVDFVFEPDEVDGYVIHDFDEIKDIYGQGITESLILVKNIKINTSKIELLGVDKNTWKFQLNNECDVVKFKCKEDDKILQLKADNWDGTDIELEIVGKPRINNYNGIISNQIIVSDYNILE